MAVLAALFEVWLAAVVIVVVGLVGLIVSLSLAITILLMLRLAWAMAKFLARSLSALVLGPERRSP